MNPVFRLPFALLATLLLVTAGPTAQAAGVFRAGAAAVDVTPTKLPVRVAGSIRETWKSDVLDQLNVRCLVLDDGGHQVAIATVDTCLMGREMLDKAKDMAARSTGIPTANMLISATHAHSAPAVHHAHGTDPHIDYREFLTGKIADAIRLAHANLRPAKIGWGVGECSEYVFCRRWLMKPGTAFTIPFTDAKTNLAQMNPGNTSKNKIRPTGPADPAVTVLLVKGVDGKPISLLGNYSTHYAGAPGISADYFGVFADEVAKRLGAENQSPPFVGLISNGASGDANCNDVASAKRKKYDRFIVAKAVVDAAMKAVDSMKFRDWVPVRAAEIELALKIRKPSRSEVAEAKAYLDKNVGDRPIKTWAEDYARETVLLSEWPDRHRFKLQALRLGAFGFAAAPCELYGSTGLKIKAASPFKTTMVVGLANGYSGYLPPPDQFQYGGYTTWRARTSMLEHGAEPVIRKELQRLLTATKK
jgi:neutral ceramidase